MSHEREGWVAIYKKTKVTQKMKDNEGQCSWIMIVNNIIETIPGIQVVGEQAAPPSAA